MSSIIKGQRIRSESTLEIENTNAYTALREVDENLTTDIQEQKEDIKRKIQQVESKASVIIQEATEEAIAKATVIIKEGQDRVKIESAIVLEQAQEEGYQAGYQMGYEEGKLEAQSLIDEGKQVLLEANEQKQQLLDDVEPKTIEMIIRICGKLIDEEINHNKDTILLLIRKALGQVSSDTSEISVKVSPDEYEYVLENKGLIAQGTANPENMQIKTDANLTKGACVIETPFGSVACNVNEAFSEIKKQMRLICSQE